MKTNLYIPQKIKIGFVKRNDTFTEKLAYLTYYDEKNVLRKQVSWDNWRDHKIEPVEIDNNPMSGFVFNKGIQRFGYHSNSGRAVARVHDPRNFEFEISIENMFGIMMNNDILKRDIQGDFVYAWSGKDLILLPTNSVEYKESQAFTEKQYKSITSKELVKGRTYIKRKTATDYLYMGYFHWYELAGRTHLESKGKKHIFYANGHFEHFNPNTLAEAVSDDISEKYPELIENFQKSKNAQPFTEFTNKPVKINNFNKGYNSRNNIYYKDFGQDIAYSVHLHHASGLNRINVYDKIMTFKCTKNNGLNYCSDGLAYITANHIITKYPELKSFIDEKKYLTMDHLERYLNDEGYSIVVLRTEAGFEMQI